MSANTEISVYPSSELVTIVSRWAAYCLFKAGRYDELLHLNDTAPEVIYFQVLALLCRGDDENAWQLLQQIKDLGSAQAPIKVLESHLFTKKILRRYFQDGQQDISHFLQDLNQVEQDNLTYVNNQVDLWLAFSYQCLGDRSKSQLVFERLACNRPFDLNLAHTWGIFAYSWASDLIDKGQTNQALLQLEAAIANFAFILVNDLFWQEWVQVRCQRYETSIDGENITELRSQIEDHIIETLIQKLGLPGGEYATELSRRWEIAWQQELATARTLKKLGRFRRHIGGNEVEVGFGPLFMKHRQLEDEIKEFFVIVSQPPPRWMRELMERGLKPEAFDKFLESQDPKQVTKLKRLFSELGPIEVLVDRGQWQEALGLLENNQSDPVIQLNLLSIQELNTLRWEMITQAQLQIAQNTIRDREADFSEVKACWRMALQSSQRWDKQGVTKHQIVQTTLGRVEALQRRQLDRAIELLELAHDLLPEGQIAGKLAELLRRRVVPKANQAVEKENVEDLELCLPDFRRSLSLNPNVKQTRLDLCQVLKMCASWYYQRRENRKATEFLGEIICVAEEGLKIHKSDEYLSRFLQDARWHLQMVQGTSYSQETITPELFFEMLFQILDEAADDEEPTAAQYNRSGLDLSRRGDYAGAIDHFARALEIDPDFEPAQTNLKQTVRSYMNQLVLQGEIERAFVILGNFKQRFPHL